MRVVSVPSWKFANVVVEQRVWGSNRSRFGKWSEGETVIVLVGHDGVVVGTVVGKQFVSDQMIWDEDLFEFRIRLTIMKVIRGDAGRTAAAAVRKALAAGLGNIYGSYIMSQTKLPEEVERLVMESIRHA